MLKNFRTYQLSIEFYRLTKTLSLPRHLRDQLNRASSSIVLNIAEGAGRGTPGDQKRFFDIAMGSLRESQAILDLAQEPAAFSCADLLAAHLFRLIRSCIR